MSKTIVEKLNLHKYKKTAVLNQPSGEQLLKGLDQYDTELKDTGYDLIFAFAFDMESMQQLVKKVIDDNQINEDGYLFVAYPKKGNKVYPTYIHRDELMDGLGADEDGYIGSSSLKFARMVGMNEVFTVVGLKEEARSKRQRSPKPSQSVDDYIAMIPAVEKDLHDDQAALAFYRSLTQGYRKGWARYVYSAVQEETREKRREEMKAVLGAGFKSMDLYRRRSE